MPGDLCRRSIAVTNHHLAVLPLCRARNNSKLIKSEFYSKWTSFSQWLVNEKAFLTFSPKTLVTTPWQMQKLFLPIWWVPKNNEKLNLKVKVGFTDGTSGSFTTGQQTGDITQKHDY